MWSRATPFKVFCSFNVPKRLIDQVFAKYNGQIEIRMNPSIYIQPDELIKNSQNCQAIVCIPYNRIDGAFLDATRPALKMISTFSVGYEHIDLRECAKREIRVANSPYGDSGAMAEYVIGFVLSISRNIISALNVVKQPGWETERKDLYWMSGVGLKGSTVGIFGLGNIGMEVANRLSSFKVKEVIYHNRKVNPAAESQGFRYVSFDELLASSDYLICTCSANESNQGIFDQRAFARMKPTSIFINVARGSVVNQADLHEALTNKRILAAGLDVTTPMPLPNTHPLYSLPNCFITPHLAWAETATTDTRILYALNNVLDYYLGRPIENELK